MFESRLKLLLIVLAIPVLFVVLRLVQLQVARGERYRDDAQHMLLRPVHEFPFIRGDITDHEGRRLAFDAPCWDICVHYAAIAQDKTYLRTLARKRFPQLPREQAEAAMARELTESWQAISAVSGLTLEELNERSASILRRVQRWKAHIEAKRRVEMVISEEQMVHPVVAGIDQNQQALARERLARYDWIEVAATQKRQYAGGPAMGHLLGSMHEVGPEQLAAEEPTDMLSELADYALGERYGVIGAEALGERILRGRRGRSQEDVQGRPVGDPIEPVNGRAMRLTLDLPLQQSVYQRLSEVVRATPFSTGGCAVVLDIPSREVVAMVDYPSVDPNMGAGDRQLAHNPREQPLLFRAVRGNYQPGSTVKPMLLAGALTDGTVNANTHVSCDGALFHEPKVRWRCTGVHPDADPIFAIQHSCNVFFCKMGGHMGVERIAHWMSLFGLGRGTGTGLLEEASGGLPTGTGAGDAYNAGIGQGDATVTPLQIANMMATIASGTYRPVRLWVDDPAPRTATLLPIPESAWRLVREGMFRVVNVLGGTGFGYATLAETGEAIIIGKTGSAQAPRLVLERVYTCHLTDGTVIEKSAPDAVTLRREYPGAKLIPGRIEKTWPPAEVEDPTHAWFAGYLTSKQHYLENSNGGGLNVAVVVLVEYGGHGGGAAGPLAAEIVRDVLGRQSGTLPE